MRTGRLFLLTIKQAIKKPIILILMLISVILSFAFKKISDSKTEMAITAGFYLENEEGTYKDLKVDLLSFDGLIDFVYYDDMNKMIDDVKSYKLECGYVIDGDMFSKMMDNKITALIHVIKSNKTTMDSVINEALYSNVFPHISYLGVSDYLMNDSGISEQYKEGLFDESTINKLFKTYQESGSGYQFSYEGEPQDYKITKEEIFLSPVRGILCLIVLISSFAGAYTFYKENENPVFTMKRVRIVYITVPVIFTSIVSLISLFLSHTSTNLIKEIFVMLLYSLICIIYTLIISSIIKKEVAFASLLPIIVIASIICTPILFDLSEFVPLIRYLKYLWPTNYYLMLF